MSFGKLGAMGRGFGHLGSPGKTSTPVDIFVLAGQSNGQGLGSSVALAGSQINPAHWSSLNSQIQIWDPAAAGFVTYQPYVHSDPYSSDTCWGLEAEFAYRYLLANPTKTIYFVKYTVGSTPLAVTAGQDWNVSSTGDLYDRTTTAVSNAKAWLAARGKTGTVKAAVWVQGEQDATDTTQASAYQTNLTNFISSSRAAWGYTRFILARIRAEITGRSFLSTVRTAQETVMSADQNVEMVSEDAMLSPDGVHLATTELDNLGGLAWDIYNKWYAQGTLAGAGYILDFNNDRYAKPFVAGDLTTMKSCLLTDLLTFVSTGTTQRYYVARDPFAVGAQTGNSVYKNNLAANAIRFNWFNSSTKRQARIEGSFQNAALWDRDLTNVAWVATNITAAKDQTGADGTATAASSITATANNGTILQSITAGAATRISGALVKRITGSGALQMTQDGGTTWTTVTVTGSYTYVSIPAVSVTNPQIGFRIATSGDAFAIDLFKNEANTAITMPIATTSIAVTRPVENADSTSAVITGMSGTDGTIVVRGQGMTKSAPAIIAGDSVSIISKRSNGQAAFNNATVAVSPGSGGFSGAWGIAVGYSAAGMRGSFNGGAVVSDVAAVPAHATSLRIGGLASGSSTSYIDSDLDLVAFFPSLVPDATLQALAVAAA